MKKLGKLNLHQLNQVEMNDRTMNMVRGGNRCGCGCEANSKNTNSEMNWNNNIITPGSYVVCSLEGEYNISGDDRMPGLPYI